MSTYAKREVVRLRAAARASHDASAARDAIVEAEFIEACEAVRIELLAALNALDDSHLADALAPLRRVDAPLPPAIARPFDDAKRSFEKIVALVGLLARGTDGFAREDVDEIEKRLFKNGASPDDCTALVLLAAAKGRAVPKRILERSKNVGALLDALKLERPATVPPSDSLVGRPPRRPGPPK